MAHPTWPLFDVVIRTPLVELRLPTDDEYSELIVQADESIYASTGLYPFTVDWIGKPTESMRYLWKCRSEWTANSWTFGLAVFVDGRIVGSQDIRATNFGAIRSVSTGSWLLAEAQRDGIGTEVRTAVLHLAFAGLGAVEAHSAARVGNTGSEGVSRKLGYEFTHRESAQFRGERADQTHMLLRREVWENHPLHQRDDIVIEGLEPVLDWFTE